MSEKSIISRETITFTASAVELEIPPGTNKIWILNLSDDALLTVEVNEQTATPEDDAEFYQMTNAISLLQFPFYAEMTKLYLSSPAASTAQVEFRRR